MVGKKWIMEIEPHDIHSKTFKKFLARKHPAILGWVQGILMESRVTEILNELESQGAKVISLNYLISNTWHFWHVLYRDEQKPARIDGSRSDNPRVRKMRIAR